jgi:exodeoxyribonuclease III
MKLISWNVNGVRAIAKKGFVDQIKQLNPDILCLQETKAQNDQVSETLLELDEYQLLVNSAVKKGYSGTAILTKQSPLSSSYDIGIEEHDQEGRVICAEFSDYYLVNVYTPNSGSELKRLTYRQQWDSDFLNYLKKLEESKPVIICGDLNVAHRDIDLARPKANYNKSAGFMQEEINGINNLTASNFLDTFRQINPETIKYSWWSYRAGARERNVGWRIDYFLCSITLIDKVLEADILNQVMGSDHCPVAIELAI